MDWSQDFALGRVPDSLPYGLDGLAAHGLDVLLPPDLHSTSAGRIARRVVTKAMAGIQWADVRREVSVRRPADLILAWDERRGIPNGLYRGLDARSATGVIWLTEPSFKSRRPDLVKLARRSLTHMDAVWALSKAQLPILVDDFGVPADRVHHLRFGVDTDFWRPEGARREPGLVVSVGNDRHRDHSTLVKAVGSAQQQATEIRLTLVTRSSVPLPRTLGTRYPQLPHQELRRLYGRASVAAVAVQRNLHVSGVTAVLEAMAMGLPVVCTATPGMEDYVKDGQTGVLTSPGNAAQMADAIARLVREPDAAAAMGLRAREWALRSARSHSHATQIMAMLKPQRA